MPELITLLEQAKVLGKLTAIQKKRLTTISIRRALKRGSALYYQGDISSKVFMIASGKLQSVIQSLDGRSYVIFSWEQGEEFWSHSLFDGEPMPSTLEAAQDSVIYQWEGEPVLQMLFENQAATRALLTRQVKMIRKRRDTIADLAFQPVTGRLAKLLLEQVPASETSASRDLTLDQIASMVASSPEVICRTLYSLQRSGLLQVTRANITLRDRAALERLASAE